MEPKLPNFESRKLSNLKLGSLKLEISSGSETVKFDIFGSTRDFQLHFFGPPSTPPARYVAQPSENTPTSLDVFIRAEGGAAGWDAEADPRKVKLEIHYGTETVKLEAGNLEWNRKCQTLNLEN